MTILSLLSPRGGTGTSLVATNLGVLLAGQSSTLLVDLHTGNGCDDLLLDLPAKRSWLDLLPVAHELTERHLELASATHTSGLHVLEPALEFAAGIDEGDLLPLLEALAENFSWLLLDVPSGLPPRTRQALTISNVLLLVTTADPPALRAAKHLVAQIPENLLGNMGLVINQITRRHPAHPADIAASLELPLIAALPPDSRAVGYQVSFGRACVSDPRSTFGKGVIRLYKRLAKHIGYEKTTSSLIGSQPGVGG